VLFPQLCGNREEDVTERGLYSSSSAHVDPCSSINSSNWITPLENLDL